MLRGLARVHSGAEQKQHALVSTADADERCAYALALGWASPAREAAAAERAERRCGAKPARRSDRRWFAHGRKRL
eukprot:809658-Pleurochrysis_carterae.AAC.2